MACRIVGSDWDGKFAADYDADPPGDDTVPLGCAEPNDEKISHPIDAAAVTSVGTHATSVGSTNVGSPNAATSASRSKKKKDLR